MYCSSLEVSTPIKRILKISFKNRLYSTNCAFPFILRLAHVLLRGVTTLHNRLPQSNPPSLLACHSSPLLSVLMPANEWALSSKWGQTTPCLSLTLPLTTVLYLSSVQGACPWPVPGTNTSSGYFLIYKFLESRSS